MEITDENAIVATSEPVSVVPTEAVPLTLSFNDRIRPLLDVVDRLRLLKVTQEGIHLPTIVVVGDQSAGKSSVLESLARINLPRGQGICTRIPLIMRLKNHSDSKPELHLEYQGKTVSTDEAHVSYAINTATEEIAGFGKGISNTPLTLAVKKKGVPDLTMVDLPGITRVPVHGQPEDIYEQITSIIMEYIKPEESIILNVLSATVDFPTCESIRMSQRMDKNGHRTLAVVTKVDKSPEGLLEKVMADDVNIGLGYVCVRNRIGDESYEEARIAEAVLFESHSILSKIGKSMVGVPMLAHRLDQIQASIMAKCLPDIVRKINEKLQVSMTELNKLPRNLTSVAEAITLFIKIVGSSIQSLRKVLLRGEFDEFPDDREMHCTNRLAEMLNKFNEELQKSAENKSLDKFLMNEIKILEENTGIWLPNFLPRTAFLLILQQKVKEISETPVQFMDNVWNFVENVVINVLTSHLANYPQLQSSTRRATRNLIARIREKSLDRVTEIMEMEKLSDYTCSGEYVEEWGKLMSQQGKLMEVRRGLVARTDINIEGFRVVNVRHLRDCSSTWEQAFDMKMRMTAYWKIVVKRIVDNVALYLLFNVNKLIENELEREIVEELQGNGGIDKMLEEAPSLAIKRERLNKSVKVLRESKKLVGQILDKFTLSTD